MSWDFYNTPFKMDSSDYLSERFIKRGAWTGHRRFGYDLVRNTKPKIIVELGTQYGTSFFSFCQAVKDGGLKSNCYAIDTWKGDPHSGFYGEEVYQAVSRFVNEEYSDFAKLIRTTFDDSLWCFQDESIDLLHIDGYHTYEAVKHDYSTWFRKIAKNGIILLHDISVNRADFGVYKLWDELKSYPHIEFNHSNGLGVVFPKGYDTFNKIMLNKENKFQNIYEDYS